jgi:dihydrofolate synthase / folylpolyglutamate synthase
MITTPIKTSRVKAGDCDIYQLLDENLTDLQNGDVLAITSKIISLCENRIAPASMDKETLLEQEAELFLPASESKYGYHFTITNHTLAAMAGIDQSNGGDCYVLWPKDPQQAVNGIRQYLLKRFGLTHIGVLITDSSSRPMRRGATGIALAHSGFKALHNYIGEPDLFGQPFRVSQANIAEGLAGASVLVMGEGTEQTPLCVMSDLPFVEFQTADPDEDELHEINITMEDDLYAPFLASANWQSGQGQSSGNQA